MKGPQSNEVEAQITQCIDLLKEVLGESLLGIYLYGSSVVGGLQKYSDLDLFVVSDRPTTFIEKSQLIANILQISGIYQKSSKPPVEMIIVVKSEINPWHYPPYFDFQYGDWLRKKFERGNIEPWNSKEMPDLALLITRVLLASKTLMGPSPNKILPEIPYSDFMAAISEAVDTLMPTLGDDTRNVLLTYARIWSTVETDTIRSKPAAAIWVANRLPEEYRPVIKRTKAICTGEENEYWDDLKMLIQPCAEFMVHKIHEQISLLKPFSNTKKSIKLAVD